MSSHSFVRRAMALAIAAAAITATAKAVALQRLDGDAAGNSLTRCAELRPTAAVGVRRAACFSAGSNAAAISATLRFSERTASGWTAPKNNCRRPGLFVNWGGCCRRFASAIGALVAHWLPEKRPEDLRLRCAALLLPSMTAKRVAAFLPHHDARRRNMASSRCSRSLMDSA